MRLKFEVVAVYHDPEHEPERVHNFQFPGNAELVALLYRAGVMAGDRVGEFVAELDTLCPDMTAPRAIGNSVVLVYEPLNAKE